jgi:prepilin-type N-terminal cleavage/methylation domain-containing protein
MPREFLTPSIDRAIHRVARAGFTLVESMLAAVILSIAVIGLGGALAASSKQTTNSSGGSIAQSLANELMEEICGRAFLPPASNDQPGYKAGNTDRSKYDNVADYDGYTDSSPFRALNGDVVNVGGSYTRSVAFEYRATPSGTAVPSGDFGMVTVTVMGAGGQSVRISRLVANTTLAR